ncbi:hypothetical protein LPJ61_001526 [Coemansia biformis]|uniref:t-SNARE coiled-coil homology domain-containing protein n=1 Tax=Coemansia biformis TaxID=1286918 RepID=A0A9W7YF14_9FUNG|nr:hypothetical protein LPJ61_001526 [Coemansia biformis]
MDSIKHDIAQAHKQIDRVDEAYRRALDASGSHQASVKSAMRDDEVNRAKNMFSAVKAEMAALNRMKEGYRSSSISEEQKAIVASMYKSLADSATGLLGRYRDTVKQHANEYRERLKKQYLIANPDATESEVRAAIEDDEADQAFGLGIQRSNKHGNAKYVLDRVKERRDEVKKIEKAIVELAELFAEMSKMVNEQQESIDSIETAVEASYTNVDSGHREIKQAVVITKKTRKLRWWFLAVLIIALIVIAVALYLKFKK